MRAMLLIFLGVCLGGCVAESQRTDDVSAPEVAGEAESDPSFSSSPFVGDKRTVVGTTRQALTPDQRTVDERPPPQPWAPPANPPSPGDGKNPGDPK